MDAYRSFVFTKTWLSGVFMAFVISLDEINISYIGFSFKLNVLLVACMGIYLLGVKKNNKLISHAFYVIFFVVVSLCAVFSSDGWMRGVLYTIYTFIVIYLCVVVFYTLARRDPECFFNGFLAGLMLQVAISFFLYISGLQERAHFLYYEPSYFAISLIPLFAFFVYNLFSKGISNKFVLVPGATIFLFFISAKSANGLIIFFVVFSLMVICFTFSAEKTMWNRFGINSLKVALLTVVLCIPFIFYLFNYSGDDLLVDSIKKIVLSEDKMEYLWDRMGNRGNRILLAWDVFKDNYFLGVGPGNYISHISEMHHVLFDEPKWLSPQGKPPVNMYLEVAVYTGLAGLSVFMLLVFNILLKQLGRLNVTSCRHVAIYVSVVVFLIVINVESSYLRLYFWGWVGILFAFGKYGKKKNPNAGVLLK